jgi:hypothetical protein
MGKKAGKRVSQIQEWGYDRRIREVLWEDSRSSMYRIYDNVIYVKKKGSRDVMCYQRYITHAWSDTHDCSLYVFYDPYWLFIFRKLKINHDSHEFIHESSTVANSNNEWMTVWTVMRLYSMYMYRLRLYFQLVCLLEEGGYQQKKRELHRTLSCRPPLAFYNFGTCRNI